MIRLFASVVVPLAALAFGCADPTSEDASRDVDIGDTEVGPSEISETSQKLTVNSCSDAERTILFENYIDATRIAKWGRDWARQQPASDGWIQHWFGVSSDISHVRNTLSNVYSRLYRGSMDIVCDHGEDPSCGDDSIARAQSPQTIRICLSWWGYSKQQQSYNFLHEVAHHSGAPTDEGGWHDGNASLAQSNPWAAARSAYNYDFYYEGWWL